MGQRIVVERSTDIVQSLTRNTRPVTTNTGGTNATSALVVRTNPAGSNNNLSITAGKTDGVHRTEASMTHVMGQITAGVNDKLV
ncbi:hypothetical protein A2U01_0077069, partial [Trifolium medium]|nr:hypothetical protein [Trifolium medium]